MLTQPILVLETTDGLVTSTFPDALAQLGHGRILGFDGLASHQRHAWYLFLCQIAALALVRSGEAAAAEDDAAWRALADADAWRERLASLTPGCADTAWSLVARDIKKPALLQPPIRTGGFDAYKPAGVTPDEIDVLVTAKAHDVKAARLARAEPRHWLFALVALQTLQGYSGRGNFGIARMNGGFASRPLVMLSPGRDLAARFRRGVQAALIARAEALKVQDGYFRADGSSLLWLEAWDEDRSLGLHDLDPLFVEICRRLRLVHDADGRIEAWMRPSQSARIDVPKEAKGNLGDAWTPINAQENAALTVGSGGFDYRLLQRLLTPSAFHQAAAMRLRPGDTTDRMWLHAAVLVRGQGKTEGLHERWLPVKAKTKRRLEDRHKGAAAGALGEAMIADAAAAKKALRTALLVFLQGAPDQLDLKKDERARDDVAALDQRIDGVFFEHWFARIDANDDAGLRASTATAWQRALVDHAREVFDAACTRLSPPGCRIERARAMAELSFWRLVRKAGLVPPKDPTDEEAAA